MEPTKFEPRPGDSLNKCVADAKWLSKNLLVAVRFSFNGVEFLCNEETNYDDAGRWYESELTRRHKAGEI